MIKLIKCPYVRLEMEGVFEELADFDKQKECLNNSIKSPSAYWHWLRYYVLDDMYNGFWYDEYEEEHIGEIFCDENEAKKYMSFAIGSML